MRPTLAPLGRFPFIGFVIVERTPPATEVPGATLAALRMRVSVHQVEHTHTYRVRNPFTLFLRVATGFSDGNADDAPDLPHAEGAFFDVVIDRPTRDVYVACELNRRDEFARVMRQIIGHRRGGGAAGGH